MREEMTSQQEEFPTVRVSADVSIRAARAGDLELLARWNDSVGRVVVPTLRRQDAGDALVLLALIERWPVGHLLVDFAAMAAQGAAHLWHMGVHDSVRSRGIGSELITTAERLASRRGLSVIALEVEKDNPDARRLYERLGYSIVGERDEVWPEPDATGKLHEVAHPCWLMRKHLTGDMRYGEQAPEQSRWAVSPSWCPDLWGAKNASALVREDRR